MHAPPPVGVAGPAMAEREERRFVELPRDSVRLMAESAGLELSDEVAALLAEDVCYRLREATQVPGVPGLPGRLAGNPGPAAADAPGAAQRFRCHPESGSRSRFRSW